MSCAGHMGTARSLEATPLCFLFPVMRKVVLVCFYGRRMVLSLGGVSETPGELGKLRMLGPHPRPFLRLSPGGGGLWSKVPGRDRTGAAAQGAKAAEAQAGPADLEEEPRGGASSGWRGLCWGRPGWEPGLWTEPRAAPRV